MTLEKESHPATTLTQPESQQSAKEVHDDFTICKRREPSLEVSTDVHNQSTQRPRKETEGETPQASMETKKWP